MSIINSFHVLARQDIVEFVANIADQVRIIIASCQLPDFSLGRNADLRPFLESDQES